MGKTKKMFVVVYPTRKRGVKEKAFLALCLNDNRDNRDNSLVEQAYRKAINQELSLLSLLSFKTPQAMGKTKKNVSCRLKPLKRGKTKKELVVVYSP